MKSKTTKNTKPERRQMSIEVNNKMEASVALIQNSLAARGLPATKAAAVRYALARAANALTSTITGE